jgi:hypothetical protein
MLEPAPLTRRWVKGDAKALSDFAEFNRANLAKDRDGDPVFMARSVWDVSYQQERNPELTFSRPRSGKGRYHRWIEVARRNPGSGAQLFGRGAFRAKCLPKF